MMKTYKESLKARCTALLVTAACATGLSVPAQAQISTPEASQKASAEIVAAPLSNPGRIQFYGQSPANTPYGHVDPIDACPNIVNTTLGIGNPIGAVSSQPYRFEFNTKCLGNYYNLGRPPFIWTIKYLTESGRIYQERIGDNTKGDYSRVKIYFYDRVPYSGTTPTNLDATIAGGNANVSLSPVTANANTAQPGEIIYGIRLECTGYSCEITDDVDAIDIRYYGRRPSALAIANAPAELCRNASYTLNANAVFDASAYLWSASNGASIVSNGASATLSLANVPAGANSVTVNVVARNTPGYCGAYYSPAQTLTLPLARSAAQPQNLTLSNGLCPTPAGNTKTASITPGVPGTVYSWTVSGAGAAIIGANTGTDLTAIALSMPQAGSVTVAVRAKTSDCGGYSAPLTQTFQIGNVVTVPVSGITQVSVYCSADYWCYDHSNHVEVDNPQPGLKYRMFISNVVPAETNPNPFYHTKVLQVAADGTPSGDIYLSGPQVRSFDLIVITENPCPAPGTPASSFFSKTYNIVPVNGDASRNSHAGDEASEESDKPGQGAVLYPNPTTGIVSIAAQKGARYDWVKVLDAQGRVVREQRASGEVGVTSVDLKTLPTGLYQVQLFDGKTLVKERIVKE